MLPKTRIRVARAEAHEASDAESDQAPSPPPRGRSHGQGKGRGRSARQADEPVNLATKMRGVHQTLNTLVELLVQQQRGEPQPHTELTPPVKVYHQPHVEAEVQIEYFLKLIPLSFLGTPLMDDLQ